MSHFFVQLILEDVEMQQIIELKEVCSGPIRIRRHRPMHISEVLFACTKGGFKWVPPTPSILL